MNETADGLTAHWRLEDDFRRLPEAFYTSLSAEPPSAEPVLVHASAAAAALVDLDPSVFARPDFPDLFSGRQPIPGFTPFASVYAGHQFGHYVPQLGDGRALTIAQMRNRAGELWDVQLKGAGRTPYSRFADGRAVMRSSIREYLCSEAMAALGVPTTRALCLVATREAVARETWEPGAIVTRLMPGNVRFGHFEFFHHSGRPGDARLLADHVIAGHFPHLAGRAEIYAAWFAEVVQRTARLVAAWQSLGFAHGVMNTDNMSILGLTIDYGPFGFLDAHEPGFICNHSDSHGRYAFNAQPSVALWNLNALASALSGFIAADDLKAGLLTYEPTFRASFTRRMADRLGLVEIRDEDPGLRGALLKTMAAGGADHTLTFRELSRAEEDREAWTGLFAAPAREQAAAWLDLYLARIVDEPDAGRRARMDRANPKYVLRNWVAETAIRAIEDRGDVATLDRIFRAVTAPFDENPFADEFAAPPPPDLCGLEVSCSS